MPRAKKVKRNDDAEIMEQIADIEGIKSKTETIDDKEDNLTTTITADGNDVVIVYDTETGQPSKCLKYMLPRQLQKKRSDGSRVFTVFNPKIKSKVGSIMCLLHPERIEREHYDEIGLAVCNKSNLTSEYQMNRHMQKKHKMEWEVIQAEIKKQKEEEDRQFQRELLSKVSK